MKTIARILACVVLALAGSFALANTRSIPVAAKAVTVSPNNVRSLIVDGKEVALTAGARIYSAENRTIVPNQVPVKAKARAIFERTGAISEVWILTPAEIASSAH